MVTHSVLTRTPRGEDSRPSKLLVPPSVEGSVPHVWDGTPGCLHVSLQILAAWVAEGHGTVPGVTWDCVGQPALCVAVSSRHSGLSVTSQHCGRLTCGEVSAEEGG